MKSFLKNHYILSTLLALFILYIIYRLIQYICLDTTVTIVNHTELPISYSNFQYTNREGSFEFETEDEYESFKYYYVINKNDSETVFLDSQYWKLDKPTNMFIDLRYQSDYLSEQNIDDLNGALFTTKPDSANQKSHCGYQIDVYPNRKTVVTPTNKRFCIKPMYYYESN